MRNSDMPAMPTPEDLEGYYKDPKTCKWFVPFMGLTKLEALCIRLGVPETGDPDLDEIIRRSERKRLSGLAMQGVIASDVNMNMTEKQIAGFAISQADALLAELEKEQAQ